MAERGTSKAVQPEKPAVRRVEIELAGNDVVKSKDIVRMGEGDHIDVRLGDEIAWNNSQGSMCKITFKGGVCPFESEHKDNCEFTVEPGETVVRAVVQGKPNAEFWFSVMFGGGARGNRRGTPRIIIQK